MRRLVYGTPEFARASRVARTLAAGGRSGLEFLPRGVGSVFETLWRIARLPTVVISLSDGPAGRRLGAQLGHRTLGVPTGRLGQAVLDVRRTEADYLRGRRRQALRTNVANSRRSGVVCREEINQDEQLATALRLMARRGAGGTEISEFCHRYLVPGCRMFVAEQSDGSPVALATVSIDVEAARLHTLIGAAPEVVGPARYLVHLHMVNELRSAGVRYLLVESGLLLADGSQYFQHLVGFEIANVRVRRLQVH